MLKVTLKPFRVGKVKSGACAPTSGDIFWGAGLAQALTPVILKRTAQTIAKGKNL